MEQTPYIELIDCTIDRLPHHKITAKPWDNGTEDLRQYFKSWGPRIHYSYNMLFCVVEHCRSSQFKYMPSYKCMVIQGTSTPSRVIESQVTWSDGFSHIFLDYCSCFVFPSSDSKPLHMLLQQLVFELHIAALFDPYLEVSQLTVYLIVSSYMISYSSFHEHSYSSIAYCIDQLAPKTKIQIHGLCAGVVVYKVVCLKPSAPCWTCNHHSH